MGRYDDTALTVLESTAQYGILVLGSHLGKHQCGSHTSGGMSRRVRSAGTQALQTVGTARGSLIVLDYRTDSHILGLGIL